MTFALGDCDCEHNPDFNPNAVTLIGRWWMHRKGPSLFGSDSNHREATTVTGSDHMPFISPTLNKYKVVCGTPFQSSISWQPNWAG